MFMRIASAGVLVCLVIGCAKKTAKNPDRADHAPDASPAPVVEPARSPGEKTDEPKKESWLRPRPKDGGLPVDAPAGGKQPWVQTPPVEGKAGFSPLSVDQPGPAVVPPPMGVPQQPVAPPAATSPPSGGTSAPAGKVVTKADINEIFVLVHYASLASGKMPSAEFIYQGLVKADAKAAELVRGGYIILTGATQRESIWAYERNAPTRGGWIAGHNGPEEISAAEFARRIRQ